MSQRDVVNLALDDLERARVILDAKLKGVRPANDPLASIRHAVRALTRVVDELPA